MIHLLTALPCEAKPLIRHYRLTRQRPEGVFPLYQSQQLRLIVSGVGANNMAAAVGYLHALAGDDPATAWLNIGIAGHANKPLGTPCLVDKATDNTAAYCYYPPMLFDLDIERAPLITLSNPSDNYSGNHLYDMEGMAFFTIASRLATAELVHSAKIVSDNRDHPISNISAKRVEALVEASMRTINELIMQLNELQRHYQSVIQDPSHYQEFLQNWRFTQYQRKRLRRLLQRLSALNMQPHWPILETLAHAEDVLHTLEQQLGAAPALFSETA